MLLIPLSGLWLLSLGGPAAVQPQPAQPPREFALSIELPGTTETRQVSPTALDSTPQHLGRVRKYEGVAVYQREVDVPAEFAGKWGEIHLERSKFVEAWWDDAPLGSSEHYLSPAEFSLSAPLTAGRHRLTVLVDNREERRPFACDAHQFSDNTQTNWNGLLGRLELRAYEPVDFRQPRVYPKSDDTAFVVCLPVVSHAAGPEEAEVAVEAESFNHAGAPHRPAPVSRRFTVQPGNSEISLALPLGSGVRAWDEFSPALYRLKVTLTSGGRSSTREVECGYRVFTTRGTHFVINGRTTFLRGKHDACVFPLTGHPPMELDGWLDYFKTLQAYGINHVRCHTWVPPEAAFQAADRLGFYLQPELPYWGSVDGRVQAWMLTAASEVLSAYASHPSFVMMTLGNELSGDRTLLNQTVQALRQKDPTRLFADGSNVYLWKPEVQSTNQFMASAKIVRPDDQKLYTIRGSFFAGDDREKKYGLVQWAGDDTRYDYEAAVRGLSLPVVSHEIGQYTVFPDFSEIPRYTGVVRATNLEFYQQRVNAHGLGGLVPAFHEASGKLAVQLYREEIEAALRSGSFGGFQLLDLQDFPGQGTALVGVLDAFMQSKGLVTPEVWRQFCSPIVPLARFDRYIWTPGETFQADLELAHYGPHDLANASAEWTLREAGGALLASGHTPTATLAAGGLRAVGRAEAVLPPVAEPCELVFSVAVRSGADTWRQNWSLWVYPRSGDSAAPAGVRLARRLDAATLKALAAGAKVVLVPGDADWAETVGGGYASDFWSWRMFNSNPGTLGLLIDPAHPALRGFPSRKYSDRRWARLMRASTPVLLDPAAGAFEVPVRAIDNFDRNESFGVIFQARVGQGRLLVCAIDLPALSEAPEAGALLRSLLDYAGSSRFAPVAEVAPDALARLLSPSASLKAKVETSSCTKLEWDTSTVPDAITDGDINNKWLAGAEDRQPWVKVDLGRTCPVDRVIITWHRSDGRIAYTLETSANGEVWEPAAIVSGDRFESNRQDVRFYARTARYVRVQVTETFDRDTVGMKELRVPVPPGLGD